MFGGDRNFKTQGPTVSVGYKAQGPKVSVGNDICNAYTGNVFTIHYKREFLIYILKYTEGL